MKTRFDINDENRAAQVVQIVREYEADAFKRLQSKFPKVFYAAPAGKVDSMSVAAKRRQMQNMYIGSK